MLHGRVVTRAVSEIVIESDGQKIHIYDVSGLRQHRYQWAQFFDNCSCILFIVSLSSYDQNLDEDRTVNRMHDSIVLFEEICKNLLLKSASIVLFLNKKDLFKIKIKKVSMQRCFPEFKGKIRVRKASPMIPRKRLDLSSQNSRPNVKAKELLLSI
jgi:signal recognition particle receptor subunit beta